MTSSATRNGGTLPDADVIASASRSMAIAREALVDVEAQVAGGALGDDPVIPPPTDGCIGGDCPVEDPVDPSPSGAT